MVVKPTAAPELINFTYLTEVITHLLINVEGTCWSVGTTKELKMWRHLRRGNFKHTGENIQSGQWGQKIR